MAASLLTNIKILVDTIENLGVVSSGESKFLGRCIWGMYLSSGVFMDYWCCFLAVMMWVSSLVIQGWQWLYFVLQIENSQSLLRMAEPSETEIKFFSHLRCSPVHSSYTVFFTCLTCLSQCRLACDIVNSSVFVWNLLSPPLGMYNTFALSTAIAQIWFHGKIIKMLAFGTDGSQC